LKIIKKIIEKAKDLRFVRQPVIAFTGDSVTQGCFEVFVDVDWVDTTFNSEEAFSQKVKKILSVLCPRTNITVVNTGISGATAELGSKRLAENVLSTNPDLTVVCYGLNDCQGKEGGLETYKESLRKIFKDLKAANSEVIFITPNMCTPGVHWSIKEKEIADIAARIADICKEGWLDKYIEGAKEVCAEENVPVCDCYKLWKTMSGYGIGINGLLSNKINHPTKEMHWMFAYELVKTMFEQE
jgi:lysophospholipase L1-like esterase